MPANFLGLTPPRSDRVSAGYVVLPLPYDATASYGKGARRGPAAILDASTQLERFDEELLTDAGDVGILTAEAVGPADAVPADYIAAVRAAAAPLAADGKFVLGLGGEHSVTIGLVQAALTGPAAAGGPVGVLQVDAHADLRDEYRGSPHSHGCVMRRLHADLKLPISPVGVRSFCRDEHDYMRAHHIEPVTPAQIDADASGAWIARALDKLPDRIYLTIDIDGLDPAAAPGTGTPEPGGLSWRQLLALVRAACLRKQVIAADIVEVAPIPGEQVTEFAAARLAYKLIVYRESARRRGSG